ncbi:MAG: sugar kinase [Ichthyobacteriaceae bacterium]|nr:sugar kinase [Ichthyobacteriaceae bacterium]
MKFVTFGEIMMRLATLESYRFTQSERFEVTYGGSEANVAVSLQNFGIESKFVSKVPDSDLGSAALMALRKYGIDVNDTVIGGDKLGTYFLEVGNNCRASKVVYDRAHSEFSKLSVNEINWDEVFEGADWFHWTGITPAVSAAAAEVLKMALIVAKQKGLTVSCDLNLRGKLWKYGVDANKVMPELMEYTDVVLSSVEAADIMLDIKLDTVENEDYTDTALRSMQALMNKYKNIKKVVTGIRHSISASHNNIGAIMWDGKESFDTKILEIPHIIDRVGGGDSFMGGLIYGLNNFDDNNTTLAFANSAACLKHSIRGDFNVVTVDEVMKLVNSGGSAKVDR